MVARILADSIRFLPFGLPTRLGLAAWFMRLRPYRQEGLNDLLEFRSLVGSDFDMEPPALEQAKARLQKAEKSLQALQAATSYEEAESAWTDFLLAASAIYSKLEQGAKSKGKSMAWFGRKKNERRNDPLLSYLHHARNSDEHGIERIVERGGNKYDLLNKRQLKFGERIACKVTPLPSGETVDAFLYGPSIGLIRVYDRRFNDHFDPPTEHLGKQITLDDNHVYGVGSLGLEYLKALVAEAETFI